MARNKPLDIDDATPKYQVIEHNGKPARLYADGSLRDNRGRLLAPAPNAAPPITTERVPDMIAAREAKRRRLYAIGAQRAVQDTRLIEEFGADAHIVERAVTMQTLATTPDAGKVSVMAAAHLDKAQGLIGERQQIDAGADAGAMLGGILAEIYAAAKRAAEREQAIDVSYDNDADAED